VSPGAAADTEVDPADQGAARPRFLCAREESSAAEPEGTAQRGGAPQRACGTSRHQVHTVDGYALVMGDTLPMFRQLRALSGMRCPLGSSRTDYRARQPLLARRPHERVFGSVGHPRQLRGRDPRRAVALRIGCPGEDDRGRGVPIRHIRAWSRSALGRIGSSGTRKKVEPIRSAHHVKPSSRKHAEPACAGRRVGPEGV